MNFHSNILELDKILHRNVVNLAHEIASDEGYSFINQDATFRQDLMYLAFSNIWNHSLALLNKFVVLDQNYHASKHELGHIKEPFISSLFQGYYTQNDLFKKRLKSYRSSILFKSSFLKRARPKLAYTLPSHLGDTFIQQNNCASNGVLNVGDLLFDFNAKAPSNAEIINYQPISEYLIKDIHFKSDQIKQQLIVCYNYLLAFSFVFFEQLMRYTLKKIPKTYLSPMIFSGSPKIYGRVIGWLAHQYNISNYRFAHGGDRFALIDRGWDFSELLYCTNYIVHGKKEMESLKRRIKQNIISIPKQQILKIETIGSIKHQKLYQRSKLVATSMRKPHKLLYFSGNHPAKKLVYSPAFKCDDDLYSDWQMWIIKLLHDQGYEVTFKRHPREPKSNFLLDLEHINYSDAIADIATVHQSGFDCLLFDFPGSAWFDALATKAPVLFFNIGPRQLDKNCRLFVEQRCSVMNGYQLDNYQIRVDAKAVSSAIAHACELAHSDQSSFIEELIYA